MINPNNFLDLWDIWVNELVGDVWLFIFLGLIIILYLSIRAKLSSEVTVLLSVLFLAIMFAQTKFIIIWAFIILFIGGLFFFKYQKMIRSG